MWVFLGQRVNARVLFMTVFVLLPKLSLPLTTPCLLLAYCSSPNFNPCLLHQEASPQPPTTSSLEDHSLNLSVYLIHPPKCFLLPQPHLLLPLFPPSGVLLCFLLAKCSQLPPTITVPPPPVA